MTISKNSLHTSRHVLGFPVQIVGDNRRCYSKVQYIASPENSVPIIIGPEPNDLFHSLWPGRILELEVETSAMYAFAGDVDQVLEVVQC